MPNLCPSPCALPLLLPPRWGLAGRTPGASGSLRFDSDLGGLSAQGGNTTVQVHLLFLRSWQGMGRARVECASGCACEPVELDAHWEREATLTDLTTLQVTPHKKCLLSLEVLPGTSSGEHLFSVSGLVVSSLEAKMERGKIGQWEYNIGGEGE